jgi:signal transduction histidine kinase
MGVPRLSDLPRLSWLSIFTGSKLPRHLWRDPWLLGVALFCGALLIYQLVVTLVHPPWVSAVTDWMRAALSWPALFVMTLTSVTASRTHRPEARAWWMLNIALLSYTLARTLWSVWDQIFYPDHAPFPAFPDIFFMLQYPFFFLAVILIPSGRSWESRVKLVLDGLLIMGSIASLFWYFLLAPLYMQSRVLPLGRFVNMYYPTADLAILFGLTITLVYHQCKMERRVMTLLIISILCLVTADCWVAWLIATVGFIPGTPPDLFWLAFYLLLPFVALFWLRVARHVPVPQRGQGAIHNNWPYHPQDYKDVLRLLFPFVVGLLASTAVATRTILAPTGSVVHTMSAVVVIVALLLLVIVRQGISLLEYIQARRERALARANELALLEINRQMETFLGMASHELKTPLTSIMIGLQLMKRRIESASRPRTALAGDGSSKSITAQDTLETTIRQAERLNRLINDLLDTSRIQSGRLELKLARVDLRALLLRTVEEQRQTAPERTIRLFAPGESPVPVWGDAERLGQVVTNYLTNALKYSVETRPVEVGLEVSSGLARVWVCDQGPGIAPEEQAHVWDRFHQVPGIEIQSGSGIGLGLGLYISRTIIESHRGQVGLESVGGQGSTFWFILPLAKPEQGAADADMPGAQARERPMGGESTTSEHDQSG